MNICTGKLTKQFFDQHLKEPIADFGGGRPSTRKWMQRTLGRPYENYDLAGGTKTLDLTKELVAERFNTITCIDVLEHVPKPFFVAQNIVQALNAGGFALVVAPFQWIRHGDDYFRYSKDGLWALFDGLPVTLVSSVEELEPEGIHSAIVIQKNG